MSIGTSPGLGALIPGECQRSSSANPVRARNAARLGGYYDWDQSNYWSARGSDPCVGTPGRTLLAALSCPGERSSAVTSPEEFPMCSARHAGFVLSLFPLFSIAVGARAQLSQQQTTGVFAEAIAKARSLAPDGPTAIGFADALVIPSAQANEIASVVHAQPRNVREVRVCTSPRDRSACHLVGVRVFIEVNRLSAIGDTAQVELSVMDETNNARQPVHYQLVSVTLVRAGSTWRATGVKRLLQS